MMVVVVSIGLTCVGAQEDLVGGCLDLLVVGSGCATLTLALYSNGVCSGINHLAAFSML